MVLQGKPGGTYFAYWDALQLLVEIELEVGSSDSLLRALNRLQTYCSSAQLDADYAASRAGSQAVWHKPWTWLSGWIRGEDTKVCLWHLHAPDISSFTSISCCGDHFVCVPLWWRKSRAQRCCNWLGKIVSATCASASPAVLSAVLCPGLGNGGGSCVPCACSMRQPQVTAC